MANKNFVVHNGLTVGPLTIDAATGDINTPGNVNITGQIGVSQIAKNDSSITINDTGTNSQVDIVIDGQQELAINSSGISLTQGGVFSINGNTVLTSSSLTANVTTLAGNLTGVTASGTIQTTGVVWGNSGVGGTLLTAAQPNVTSLGNLTSLSVGGTIQTTGIVYANSAVAATSTATGALRVLGGAGISGAAYIGSAVYIAGKTAATVDDATALAIALGG